MPRKRRQYGTGSVYQRSRDGRWVGALMAGYNRSGAPRRITVVAATEADAKRRLDARRRQVQAEGLPAVAAGRTSVASWSKTWLTEQERRLRPKTFATNASTVRVWIVPAIGHKKLEALTPADVRAVANAQRAAGRSTSTAQRTHVVLLKMLRDAIVEGHAVPPRLLHLDAPARAVNDRDAIPIDHVLRIMLAAADLPDGSKWVATFLAGPRQAERLGLTWACVDLDAAMLDISWQLQPLPYRAPYDRSSGFRVPDGYEHRHLQDALHLVRPKTAKGRRIIPLVPPVVDALRAWRDVAPRSPHGLVWPAADGSPGRATEDSETWKRLQRTAGVHHPSGRLWVLHEARHATATLLTEAGVPDSTIQAILGQSSLAALRGYQHASAVEARRAIEKIAERLQLGR